MSEKEEFSKAVRDSRIFARRRLAEVLGRAQMLKCAGVNASQVVKAAREITALLAEVEEVELETK